MDREKNYPTRRACTTERSDLPAAVVHAGRERPSTKVTVSGIVLAGTQSWGECPLERVLPRSLAPIVNCPVIFYVLNWLDRSGVQRVSICGSRHTSTLRRSLNNGHSNHVPEGMCIDYYHDVAPRGPAGCVRDAGAGSNCDVCVVVDGTIVPQIDLPDLLEAHHRSGAAVTVVVSSAAGPNGTSEERLTPLGVYVFSHRALRHVPPAGYQDIKESLIPRLYQCGESVLTYRTDAAAPRVTGVNSYLAVNEWVLTHLRGHDDRFRDYRNLQDALVHPTAMVDSTARLVGPIVVGPGSEIARGATIIGPTSIGSNSMINARAVLCRTSVWDDVVIGAGAIVDRSVVTTHANVHGGAPHRYVVVSDPDPRFLGFGPSD